MNREKQKTRVTIRVRRVICTILNCLKQVIGGDEEDRTPDLRIANATLSQLSYVPINCIFYNKPLRRSMPSRSDKSFSTKL